MFAGNEVTNEFHPVLPCEPATTMLLVIIPRTIVLGLVAEGEDTLSLLLVVHKIAAVVASIRPMHLSCALSLAIDPVAFVVRTARPSVLASLSI